MYTPQSAQTCYDVCMSLTHQVTLCVVKKKKKNNQENFEFLTQLIRQMKSCLTMTEWRQTTKKNSERSLTPNFRMRVC